MINRAQNSKNNYLDKLGGKFQVFRTRNYIDSHLKQFYCECNQGYSGKSCKKDLRYCSSKLTCINNSTCKDIKLDNQFDSDGNQMYLFEYTWLENYYGAHCQMKENICLNKTCSNHGMCVDLNNQAKCNCFQYYSGEDCEIQSEDLKRLENTIKSTAIIAI